MFSATKCFAILAVATAVVAQSASSAAPAIPSAVASLLDPCISSCLAGAAAAANCAATDIQCSCSAPFVQNATNCLTKSCPPSDLANALKIQTLECSGNSGAAPSSPSPSPSNGAASSGAAPAQTPAATNSGSITATTNVLGLGVGALVAVIGVLAL